MLMGISLVDLRTLRCCASVVCGVVVSAGASGRSGAPGNGRTARPLAVRLIVVAPQWACGDIGAVRWAQSQVAVVLCRPSVAWLQVNLLPILLVFRLWCRR
jgi:hypothetical protein